MMGQILLTSDKNIQAIIGCKPFKLNQPIPEALAKHATGPLGIADSTRHPRLVQVAMLSRAEQFDFHL